MRPVWCIVFAFATLVSCNSGKNTAAAKSAEWMGTWATAPQLVEPGNMPPQPGLSNNTIRQIVRVSAGGRKLRVRFSNLFSKQTVTLKSAAIAAVREGSCVDDATQLLLRFKGKEETTMEPGAEIFSDPVDFELKPGSLLAITIYFGETSPSITGHPGSRTTSYILSGNQVKSVDFKGAVKTDHWYVIQGIDVMVAPDAFAIAVLGNSITDGRGSGTNRQNRWTDILSDRLLAASVTKNTGVLNLGIGGNCVLRGGLGPTALARFDRDILSQSNAKYLLILEGINDIGGIKNAGDAAKIAAELIAAYTLMADKAHEKGMKVFGCTILPFEGSFYDKPFRQQARSTVNEWIRTTRKFDAIIDFDKAMRDPADVNKILSHLHDNDWLHPNEAGYKKMGEVIDLNLFAQKNKHK